MQSQTFKLEIGNEMEIVPTGKQRPLYNRSNPTGVNEEDECLGYSLKQTLVGNLKEKQSTKEEPSNI